MGDCCKQRRKMEYKNQGMHKRKEVEELSSFGMCALKNVGPKREAPSHPPSLQEGSPPCPAPILPCPCRPGLTACAWLYSGGANSSWKVCEGAGSQIRSCTLPCTASHSPGVLLSAAVIEPHRGEAPRLDAGIHGMCRPQHDGHHLPRPCSKDAVQRGDAR